jgi:acetolactate synthase-1/2/3 large subunit
MIHTQERSTEAWWTEIGAEEWSDAIVAAMKLGGVDNLFFVSGSELTFYQEAIAKAHAKGRPAPRLVTMTHEHVALNAALGNAMVRNQPAATAVHVDVGTLHYGAAIHTAWRGGYPVLMTAGTGPRAFPGSMRGARAGSVQWVQEPRDQGEIVRQYTKLDHRLEHEDNPGLMISRLLQVAMSEPRGPVYVSIPQETAMLPLAGTTRFPTRDQLGLARPAWPDPADARQIATWLVQANNPVLYTTRAGRDADAVLELVRLAELLAIPVMESGSADRLNFPMTHWAYGTGPAAKDADVVLVMEDVVPFTPGPSAPSAESKIAWVAIDPVLSRYKTMEFRADLWLPASVAAVARAVHEAATGMLTQSDMSRIADRRTRLEHRKQELVAHAETLAQEDIRNSRLTGRVVGYALGKLMQPGTIVLNDALSNGGFVQSYAGRTQPGTYFRSGSSSGGWGSGASFGVKLARPNEDVIHATGDGYFMFGTPLPALWAAGHHKAAYMAVVFVNGSYSTGTSGLRNAYPEGHGITAANYEGGTFEPTPNFAKLAEAANGYGEQVTDLAQLAPALQRGLEHTRNHTPAVIAVRVPGPMQGVSGRE